MNNTITNSSGVGGKLWSIVNGVMESVNEAVYARQAVTWKQLVRGTEDRPTLLRPHWPIIGVIMYLSLKSVAKRVCKRLNTTGTSTTFKQIALVHNIAICIFSFKASVGVWTITRDHWGGGVDNGLASVLCDSAPWEGGLNKWGMLFYLSKYWELFDTFLLIWKRRSPSFLQVYHHAVTIICAYLLQASQTPATFLFVGLNASIHTLMYAYYALTLVGIRTKLKPVMTMLQIVQFVVGNAVGSRAFFLRNGECMCESQKMALFAIIAHATFLIVLFVNFYSQTYSAKAKQKGKQS